MDSDLDCSPDDSRIEAGGIRVSCSPWTLTSFRRPQSCSWMNLDSCLVHRIRKMTPTVKAAGRQNHKLVEFRSPHASLKPQIAPPAPNTSSTSFVANVAIMSPVSHWRSACLVRVIIIIIQSKQATSIFETTGSMPTLHRDTGGAMLSGMMTRIR
jgi:hypothetical protein